MTAIERQRVVGAAQMDDDHFKLHFEKRHGDSMGGLSHFSPHTTQYVLDMYRAFHDRLHAIRVDYDHEHERS